MEKFIYKILLICLFIIFAFTVKSFATSDFTYSLDSSGNATITAYKGTESNLTIPSTIDGHNVITIDRHAFNESRNSTNGSVLKNVVVSEGIEKIGLLAFNGCENLESVKLPESLKNIDMQAFLGCSKLSSINIPSQIQYILNSTFQETNLTEVDIPENVKKVEARAFGICKNLKKVRIYSKDITLDQGVFEYGSSDLVLYGYEGSTTQTYAEQNSIKFEILSSGEQEPPTETLILNKNKLELKEGESETIYITSDTMVEWTSSDNKVATVDNGKVTAINAGKAVITVSTMDETAKATCEVIVTKKETEVEIVPIKSISISRSSLSLKVGDIEILSAIISPANATDKSVVWSSNNEKVVTIQNGKVTAKAVGTTIITVSDKDGTHKATCTVTVTEKSTTQNPDNTIAKGELPQTGIKSIIAITLILISIIILGVYIYLKKFKDVK